MGISQRARMSSANCAACGDVEISRAFNRQQRGGDVVGSQPSDNPFVPLAIACVIDGPGAEPDQIAEMRITSQRRPIQLGMRGRNRVDSPVGSVLEIFHAQIRIGGRHAMQRNADRNSMLCGAFRQHHFRARRCLQHLGQRPRVHVRGMLRECTAAYLRWLLPMRSSARLRCACGHRAWIGTGQRRTRCLRISSRNRYVPATTARAIRLRSLSISRIRSLISLSRFYRAAALSSRSRIADHSSPLRRLFDGDPVPALGVDFVQRS